MSAVTTPHQIVVCRYVAGAADRWNRTSAAATYPDGETIRGAVYERSSREVATDNVQERAVVNGIAILPESTDVGHRDRLRRLTDGTTWEIIGSPRRLGMRPRHLSADVRRVTE